MIEFGDFGISECSTLMEFVEPVENDPEHDDRPDAEDPSVIIRHISLFLLKYILITFFKNIFCEDV